MRNIASVTVFNKQHTRARSDVVASLSLQIFRPTHTQHFRLPRAAGDKRRVVSVCANAALFLVKQQTSRCFCC